MEPRGNLIIGQSGGPTAVINQSLVGAVLEAMNYDEIESIFGMKNGIQGLLKEDIIDLGKESKEHLEKVAQTPSSALGSCRYKPTEEDCQKVFEICKKYNIRYFLYIGGNDSAETSHIINEIAEKEDYELHVFHIPKTVDNDLRENDHTPGYGSAAKYVAMFFMGDNLDNMALPGVKINIVMGRHAGFLTCASVLGKRDESDGPHLIYVPERKISLEQIVDDIGNVYSKYGRALVAVSEGIRSMDGKLMIESQ
ncbi:MAG: diphosphate--fructose-6-phosphate 1-phosphotransferase, partial [Spirochaetes bacterium]|nr:diphosphate--fructose-6-phosphate 1-phosphotransferase [Spirochaetota bacterium]